MRYVETLEQAGVEFVELRGDAPNRLLIVSDPHNKPAARFTLWAESIWELPGGSYLKHGGAVYWMTDYSAAASRKICAIATVTLWGKSGIGIE